MLKNLHIILQYFVPLIFFFFLYFCLIKSILLSLGLKQTAGLYARKDFVAEEDADNVRLMKQAGAIILGVTNVSELCMWWESSNTIYGRTSNPYNTNHIVGGSSGGEVSSVC